MRIFLMTVLILNVVLIGALFELVPPVTYLSQINISFWPKALVRSYLKNKERSIVKINVGEMTKVVRYEDLDVHLDVKDTMKNLRIKSLSDLVGRWVFGTAEVIIQPTIVFGEDFERRVGMLFPENELGEESYYYDKEIGQLVYQTKSRKERVDIVALQSQLVTLTDNKERNIEIGMIGGISENEKRLVSINKKLKELFQKPITISVLSDKRRVILEKTDLLKIVMAEIINWGEKITIKVDRKEAKNIVAYRKSDSMAEEWTARMIETRLQSRFEGQKEKPLVLGIDSGPNTDGEVAEKYLEVDLSQQRMFLFEKGLLYKDFSVSTGLNYPTPVGSYKIKNKLQMGYSTIFGVWMPWWMAFEYREDIGAYLGIHELPYKLVDGQKVYRFGNYIGNKKTGGCIALSPGDSKEVFDWSFPGMDLVIFQ